MQRLDSASFVAQPKLRVPKTAKRRKRRNARRVHLPLAGIKAVIFSSRWISLFLLLMAGFALFLIGSDEEFYLTTIPVEGTTSIPAAEIVAASHLAGTHIFSADPSQAAAGIMNVPGVISAIVTVQWPNQVNIEVKEDSPIAVWMEAGTPFWVTRHGRLLPARSNSFGLLIIESETAVPVAVEETAVAAGAETAEETASETPAAQAAFVPQGALAGALQLKELRPNIDRLYFQPGSGLSYQDGRGWRAYFGTGTNMEQKLVVYETIVDELLARGVTPAYISVANQERPFYLGQ